MAAKRNPKKKKLRNSEYYNFQEVQDRLYSDSKNGRIFKNLVEIIVSEENIQLAYRNIKKNSGSKTAGTDGKTIKDIAKWQPEKVISYVRKRLSWYKPQTVRRVEIPKPNGKTRPLGIPTIGDRLIQQCILQVLEPICEAKFYSKSFGFRPNRSTEHAIAQVYKYMQVDNLHYVVDIDIKGFFDNVDHGKLLKQMWALGIRDKKLISIISAMLKAEVKEIGIPEKPFIRKDNGKVDKAPIFCAYRERSNLKECHLVRYADDFKIFCRKKSDADKIFEATRQWLKDRLHLQISTEKSSITNLKRHYSEFLGFKIRLTQKGKTKSGKDRYTVQSHITTKAEKRIKDSMKKQIKSVQKPIGNRSGHLSVDCYNAFVIGVHNYYEIATHVSADFRKISYMSYKSLDTRLKKRMMKTGQRILPYIKEKYGNSEQMRYVYDTALVPIGYIKHRPPSMLRSGVNKFTPEGRAKIHKQLEKIDMRILMYIMRNPIKGKSIEYNDNRLSLYCGQGGKCAISGKPLEIGHMHCHHIKPISKGGNDNYANLLFVTDRVHSLIHAAADETIKVLIDELKLDNKQLKKLNKLRCLAGLEEIK